MIDLEYQGRCWVAKASDLYRRVGVLGSTLGLGGEWQRRLSLARVRMLALTVQLVEIAMLYHFSFPRPDFWVHLASTQGCGYCCCMARDGSSMAFVVGL